MFFDVFALSLNELQSEHVFLNTEGIEDFEFMYFSIEMKHFH